MEVIQLDELSLGAELVVQADVKEQELHRRRQQEAPSRSLKGAVTVDAEAEEMRRKREERWMQLYPEIKECVIVIARLRPEMLKLKEERREEEEEEEEGGGRSGDPEPDCDWMKPLEQNDIGDKFRRFVKKVEVKVSWNHAPANRRGKPCGDVLRLRRDDVTTDPARRRHLRSRNVNNNNNNSQSTTEHNYSVVAKPVKDDPDSNKPISQSQDGSLSPSCGQKVRDSGSSEKKKKKPPNIVFKRVGGDQWVLGRSKVKKEKEEEEEDGGSSINNTSQPEVKKKRKRSLWAKRRQSEEDELLTEIEEVEKKMQEEEPKKESHPPQMKTKMKENSPRCTPKPIAKRQGACRKCTACLREDCGKCVNCLDKRKFGGPEKRRQRCQFRVCLVVEMKKIKPKLLKTIEAVEEKVTTETQLNTVTTATRPHHRHRGRRQTCQKDTTEEEETEKKKKKRKSWWRQFGKNKAKINGERSWTRLKTEVKKKKKRKRLLWKRRKAKRRQSEEDELLTEIEEVEKKMQEEEPKKETHQFPAFELVSGTGELLTGTHIQLNLTVDGGHFTPSILSDSTLNSLSALLPPPKEEEEAVDIDEYERTGGERGQREDGGMREEEAPGWMKKEKEEEEAAGWMKEEEEEEEAAGRMKKEEEEEEAAGRMKDEEEECSERVTEEGKYFEIEVEVPGLDSDEETLTAASNLSEITEVANDVTAKVTDDVTAHDPPEHISLSSGSFSLLGGGGGDEVTCGRGLLRLLQELRRTVLPAHWVAVLADGPLLQLLQCSRLSSMLSTIIHIQPDLCFFITVQNQLLPDTHALYHTHTQRITHLSQLVSLLLALERLVVCRGSRVRCCHLLVAPPCRTCLPCLLGDEDEEEDEEEDDEEEEEEVEEDISDKQS